ncbi:Siderophore export accessory protein MmpS4 [Mycolicibacterium vanbaalenii]|uniref:Siderophore export accessory protein MmpS4 n=1 Tax=Mycolicibacterium vanbaalenii TaxID=110539 RepID=A0A5S9RA76_MYCVN|nr:Siderophore export accessory protein MmpS4 [Mycolicibacterium vanbaalenii]
MVVLAVGAFSVWRIRGIFGSQQLPTYAGSITEDSNKSDPKIVRYEVWGESGAVADINYVDAEGDPNQLVGAALPWSIDIETDSPAMSGNIVAQGNGDFIGCRITADGEVKDERTISNVSAYIYCFTKAA